MLNIINIIKFWEPPVFFFNPILPHLNYFTELFSRMYHNGCSGRVSWNANNFWSPPQNSYYQWLFQYIPQLLEEILIKSWWDTKNIPTKPTKMTKITPRYQEGCEIIIYSIITVAPARNIAPKGVTALKEVQHPDPYRKSQPLHSNTEYPSSPGPWRCFMIRGCNTVCAMPIFPQPASCAHNCDFIHFP